MEGIEPVGAQLKAPVSAVPQGSGQGAHDPENEPQIGVGGPESQECSVLVGSNRKGAQQLLSVPEHKPTSKEQKVVVRPGLFQVAIPQPRSTPAFPSIPLKHAFQLLIAQGGLGNSILTRGVQEKWSTLSGSTSCSKSKLPVSTLLEIRGNNKAQSGQTQGVGDKVGTSDPEDWK